jgi:hypothetical protein
MASSTTQTPIAIPSNGQSREYTLFAGTSPSTTTTEYEEMFKGFAAFDCVSLFADIASPTGAAVDVFVQNSADGTTWYDYVHFTQSAAAAAAVKYLYVPALSGSIQTIGSGTVASAAPVLSSGSVANGAWHDWLRAVIKTAGNNTACAITVKALCTRRPHTIP